MCYFNQLPQQASPFLFPSPRAPTSPDPACGCANPRLPPVPSLFTQQHVPVNQEYAQSRGKIKYNLPQCSMKVNPNRQAS